MKKNYTVAICDILGFTNLVKQTPLDRVMSESIGWDKKALYHSLQQGEFPSDIPRLRQLQTHRRLGIAWYSDSILIYTREDDLESTRALISTVAWLLFVTMFNPAGRLRCGISYGEAHIDPEDSDYVGEAIVESVRLEEIQAWSGGALAHTAVQRIPEEARCGKFADWPVIPYEVPRHEGDPIQTLAINWTTGIHLPGSMRIPWSAQSDEPTEEDWSKQPRTCEKWMNMKRFHDQVCQICKPKKFNRIIPI